MGMFGRNLAKGLGRLWCDDMEMLNCGCNLVNGMSDYGFCALSVSAVSEKRALPFGFCNLANGLPDYGVV